MTHFPYNILSKVFGTEEVVRLRQKLFLVAENYTDYINVRRIASGSKAEGLDMFGSDYDVMVLLKFVQIYETMDRLISTDDVICVVMGTNDTKLGFTRLRFIASGINSYRISSWLRFT